MLRGDNNMPIQVTGGRVSRIDKTRACTFDDEGREPHGQRLYSLLTGILLGRCCRMPVFAQTT